MSRDMLDRQHIGLHRWDQLHKIEKTAKRTFDGRAGRCRVQVSADDRWATRWPKRRHAERDSCFSTSFEVAFREVADRLSQEAFGHMGVRVVVESEAVDRLAELGLTPEIIERVVRRADAEASMCTELDPPIMEGLTFWARMNRFLREELIPAGWRFDNPRNLPRTIHPSGEFAIVATTGDELTGMADLMPATKYLKGDATVQAVAINEQLMLDFGDFDPGPDDCRADSSRDMLTWFMLFHADEEGFRVELSLPDDIADGRITSWAERIILPVFARDDDRLTDTAAPGGDGLDEVVVEVTRR